MEKVLELFFFLFLLFFNRVGRNLHSFSDCHKEYFFSCGKEIVQHGSL